MEENNQKSNEESQNLGALDFQRNLIFTEEATTEQDIGCGTGKNIIQVMAPSDKTRV